MQIPLEMILSLSLYKLKKKKINEHLNKTKISTKVVHFQGKFTYFIFMLITNAHAYLFDQKLKKKYNEI